MTKDNEEPSETYLGLRVPQELKDDLKRISEIEERSVSKQAVLFLRQGVKQWSTFPLIGEQ